MTISEIAKTRFRTYTEVPARVPQAVWLVLRAVTLTITLGLVVLLLTEPALGLRLVWTLFIPILPLSFVVVPGLWRQICPMALLSQLPRTFGFSRNLTLPVKYKNLAYYFASIAFLAIVSLRHVALNYNAEALGLVMIALLLGALVGGIIYKGRSGWCGTFCPLAPIQRAYGQAPVVLVKNGYCPTCLGCQKNCYDFNPRAAIHGDLEDDDPWYSGHKEFFIGVLPGFVLGFFLSPHPDKVGILSYYADLTLWMVSSLGIYMTITRLTWLGVYKTSLLFSMAAVSIFYWYAAPSIVGTLGWLSGSEWPWWSKDVFMAVVGASALAVVVNGLRTERDYREATAPPPAAEPTAGVNAEVLRAAGAAGGNLVARVIQTEGTVSSA